MNKAKECIAGAIRAMDEAIGRDGAFPVCIKLYEALDQIRNIERRIEGAQGSQKSNPDMEICK